jgi:dolichyl-diphosphooligosaccharide--protein glycosyltransferase
VLYEQREPKRLPLLSRLLADASPLFGGNIDKTALLLSPLLSSLFMIPLFLCFWRLGEPAAGLMGGLVATFCIAYYRRTSVGWVDTDALNLFFPWTASYLMLAMHGGQRRDVQWLLAAAAGAVLYVFFLWYGKPGLTLMYAGALAVHLYLAKVTWRRILLYVATLAVFAGVVQFKDALSNLQDFAHRYLWSSAPTLTGVASPLRFPQVWSTIGEARHLPLSQLLAEILGRAELTVIGLGAFVAFAIRRWRAMAPLAPVMLLGMLSLVSSERFAFYLAPFAGIGWGLIVALAIERVAQWIARPANTPRPSSDGWRVRALRHVRVAIARPASRIAVGYFVALALFAAVFVPLSQSRQFIPRPAIAAPVFRDLQVLAHRLPADARIWTWWDFGFAIVDVTGFGVYHDGAAQYTPQTNLVATSFVSSNPTLMYDLIGFVDREGNRGIRRLAASAHDFDDLLVRMRAPARSQGDVPIYVLYTPDMMLKYSSMRALGLQRVTSGLEGDFPGVRGLRCESAVGDTLRCSEQTIDLAAGSIETAAPSPDAGRNVRLRRAVVVENGRVLREREYAAGADLTIEIVARNSTVVAAYLLDEPAFESNLNQMFVLGRYDAARFKEAYDDFPYARVFQVLAPPR